MKQFRVDKVVMHDDGQRRKLLGYVVAESAETATISAENEFRVSRSRIVVTEQKIGGES